MEPSIDDDNINATLEDEDVKNNAGEAPILDSDSKEQQAPKNKNIGRLVRGVLRIISSKTNIYLVVFFILLILGIGTIIVSTKQSQQKITTDELKLTTEDIDNIKNSETKVGGPKQTLTVESNAIFSGKVLVRDSLDVAGTIKVGGSLSLPGITVSGTSAFDQINANNLAITGNTYIQGVLGVQKTLTVSGSATFGGNISAPQLTVDSIKINKDLTLSRHIDAGGSTPSKSDGSALGSGGTSSVSGTDTAGTLKINTGNSPGTGCFATITFTHAFNETPHIVVTPVGSGASGIDYYINRSSTNFSVCTSNSPPGNTSFYFDWIAID